MIGNDIVDFQKASSESNWLRKGYLDKLFCLDEQRLILDAQDPNQMVWLLWSMKEACYKIHFRKNLIRSYQPEKIACSNLLIEEHTSSGEIHYAGQRYFSRSLLTTDFIHTSAVVQYSMFSSLHVVIGDNNNQVDHNTLFDNCRQLINENFLLEYRVVKNCHNIPDLLNVGTGMKLPLSISHHGRFLSWIFCFKQ